jgi:hypothetical protein
MLSNSYTSIILLTLLFVSAYIIYILLDKIKSFQDAFQLLSDENVSLKKEIYDSSQHLHEHSLSESLDDEAILTFELPKENEMINNMLNSLRDNSSSFQLDKILEEMDDESETTGCKHILLAGKRKGEECTESIKENNLCSKHLSKINQVL